MRTIFALLALVSLLWLFTSTIQAQTPKESATQADSRAQPGETAAQKYFTDVELLNQHNQTMRFYSDLMKGRTVVVIPFFTSCTGSCPPMNANMRRIQICC